MRVLFYILFITFILFILYSTLYFWIAVIKGKREVIRSTHNKYYITFIGSMLGLGIIFYNGFKGILSFIPNSIGSFDENGEYLSLKTALAFILASIASLFIHSKPFKFIEFLKSKEN